MKTPLIEFCDSNSELPFDSAQGPAQQPATLNPADADLQSASNQLYQHIPFDFAQGPAQGSVHQTSAMEAEALLALHQ